MEREDILENKNQSCFRWSQGSFATTLASMRPTSWTSWGRNMLAMEFGNYFNFTRGRFVVRRVSLTKAPNWGHTAHIGCILALRRTSVLNSNNRYGVDIMNEDIADNYAACVWWVSQINFPVIFSNSHKQLCILQGTGNCQSQRHYCRLRSNLPFAQCGRDSQEPQVSQFSSHSKPTSLTDFTQSKVLTQLLPGLARVQIRWEAACQEGWAEAGEDQCKKSHSCFFQNLWCIFTRVRPM